MSSGILFIGIEEHREIAAALDHARANVVPWSKLRKGRFDDSPKHLLRLQDRVPGVARPASEHIMLGNYRAAISFEEQLAGIFRHLSVSSARKDKVPSPEVMHIVCEAFGFSETLCRWIASPRTVRPERPFRLWIEEFDSGHMAVNVVERELT